MINIESLLYHLHPDGSRERMRRIEHHDAAAHDIERRLGRGTLFRCDSCVEQIYVATHERIGPDPHAER